VKSFLAMARAKPTERRRVELPALIEDALGLAACGLRTHAVTVRGALAADLPAVQADPDQLHQVVLNLVVNAQHALAERSGPREIAIRAWAEDGWVVVEVADNGPGMSEEVRRRAFEPFFTTKPRGVGTGIGLSVSRGIVEAHGGTLILAGDSGGGTRVQMRLPVTATRFPGGAAAEPPEPGAPIAGQVLVADDEERLAELIADRLSEDGLEVDVASSGAAALALIRDRAYDVLITDLRMPDMDGAQLLDAIGRVAPGLLHRAVVVTGDALGAQLDARIAGRGCPVLEKPLDVAALRRLVRRLIAPEAREHPAHAEDAAEAGTR
jgi:CheY-like chemotaxis protein/anti-sigma regulatory factor (Ser/Thr protein kinase)